MVCVFFSFSFQVWTFETGSYCVTLAGLKLAEIFCLPSAGKGERYHTRCFWLFELTRQTLQLSHGLLPGVLWSVSEPNKRLSCDSRFYVSVCHLIKTSPWVHFKTNTTHFTRLLSTQRNPPPICPVCPHGPWVAFVLVFFLFSYLVLTHNHRRDSAIQLDLKRNEEKRGTQRTALRTQTVRYCGRWGGGALLSSCGMGWRVCSWAAGGLWWRVHSWAARANWVADELLSCRSGMVLKMHTRFISPVHNSQRRPSCRLCCSWI